MTVVEIHLLMLRSLPGQILVVSLVGPSELRVDLLFVVIVRVVVLVCLIVDSDLNAVGLRAGSSHHGNRRRQGSGQE